MPAPRCDGARSGSRSISSSAITRADTLIDWSGALHSLAWWLAATNRWRTTAPAHPQGCRRRPTMPVLCSRFRGRRRADLLKSARLRLREEWKGSVRLDLSFVVPFTPTIYKRSGLPLLCCGHFAQEAAGTSQRAPGSREARRLVPAAAEYAEHRLLDLDLGAGFLE